MGGEKLNRYKKNVFIIILLFCVIAAGAQEQESQEAAGVLPAENTIILGDPVTPSVGQSPSSIGAIIRMVVVLALAAAAIYGIVFLLKKINKPQVQQSPHIKILARAHLGAGSYATVVAVGQKAWLVGSGADSVSLISEIADQETVDTMLLEESMQINDNLGGFRRMLEKLGGKKKANPYGGENYSPDSLNAENLRKRRERLRGL
ncbi:hypothetical protein FACS1894151_06310 [Spirochaetia bacterium]|nr:hypothetical protein FACS1894151_06310 [Spirochaetia bacterium]